MSKCRNADGRFYVIPNGLLSAPSNLDTKLCLLKLKYYHTISIIMNFLTNY